MRVKVHTIRIGRLARGEEADESSSERSSSSPFFKSGQNRSVEVMQQLARAHGEHVGAAMKWVEAVKKVGFSTQDAPTSSSASTVKLRNHNSGTKFRAVS